MTRQMNGTETMTEAVNRLSKQGYHDSFRAKNGKLQSSSGAIYETSEFLVDSVDRFEGTADIDDESAIFALSHALNPVKGLYIVAFGPQMDTNDVEIVQKLNLRP